MLLLVTGGTRNPTDGAERKLVGGSVLTTRVAERRRKQKGRVALTKTSKPNRCISGYWGLHSPGVPFRRNLPKALAWLFLLAFKKQAAL